MVQGYVLEKLALFIVKSDRAHPENFKKWDSRLNQNLCLWVVPMFMGTMGVIFVLFLFS